METLRDIIVALLEAFDSGATVIKTQRRRRKDAQSQLALSVENEELRLKKSLRKGKTEISTAYSRDLDRFGEQYVKGDEKSRSAVAAILLRLNAGFVSIIERFTRDKCSRKDFQALAKLSNASRIEAMKTMSRLSIRLSQSSQSGSTGSSKHKVRSKRKGGKQTSSSYKDAASKAHAKSKNATKGRIVKKVDEGGSDQSQSKSKIRGALATSPPGHARSARDGSQNGNAAKQIQQKERPQPEAKTLSPKETTPLPVLPRERQSPAQRMSLMSFASDSTKLGEIPEYRWAKPVPFAEGLNRLSGTAYPLAPWQQPEKPRSRLMRLFKRGTLRE